jgi:aminoacylase|eukprot:Stramenopile-MAST_4_protein_1220
MVSVVDAAEYEPSADPEVSFFQDLVRHKTISSEAPTTGAYRECVAFLNDRCQRIGLKTKVIEFVQGKPVLLATRVGMRPELPAILLNSHYDVVPIMAEHWDVPAFKGIIKDGKVWGRGTQDMKCVVAQYILAMERLRDVELQRTVHLSFVPDEEIGGADGMGKLVNSLEFKALGEICIALDEGLANEQNAYTVFYGERAPLWILVKSEGPTGHGSRFIADTAVSKLIGVANKALEFRSKEESKLGYSGGCKHCNAKKLGDVTTLNLTMLKTGVSSDEGKTYALNVIPTCAEAGFDVRVPTCVPCQDIEAMLNDWCKEEGLSWKYAPWAGTPITEHYVSSIDEKASPFWATIMKTFQDEFGLKLEPEVFPAGTDSRFLRENGIPSYGFSPMKNSPILLHEHNEYLDIDVFKEGVGVYTTLLPRLANLI